MPEDILDLHRRRLAGEYRQPVGGGVAGQVDQHVDAILADHRRHVVVAAAGSRPPMVGQRSEARGGGILDRHLGVAEQFDLASIMCRQQRFGEERRRVLAKIGRDVAEPQFAPRRAVQVELRIGRRKASRVLRVPAPVFGEDRLGRQVVAIVQCEQQVAVA